MGVLSQIIGGPGRFIVVVAPFEVMLALSGDNWLGVLSALMSFCTGCAFIIFRGSVVRCDEQDAQWETRGDLRALEREVETLNGRS